MNSLNPPDDLEQVKSPVSSLIRNHSSVLPSLNVIGGATSNGNCQSNEQLAKIEEER